MKCHGLEDARLLTLKQEDTRLSVITGQITSYSLIQLYVLIRVFWSTSDQPTSYALEQGVPLSDISLIPCREFIEALVVLVPFRLSVSVTILRR